MKQIKKILYFIPVFMLLGMIGCATNRWKQEEGRVHLNIGIAYIESGQYNAALKELLEAEKLTPKDPKLHYFLGIAYYYGKGLNEKAIDEFNRALDLKPDYSEAHNFLGTIYLSKGLWDKAIESFNKALSNILYDTPAVALSNMGWAYYKKGDYQISLSKYQEAIAREPNTALLPLIEKNMGMVSFARGDMDRAVRHLKKSLELAPSLAESHYWLGECYIRLNNREEAKAAFRAAIKLAPESEYGIKAKKSLDAITLP
ncbi:MAG: tetratricopeptide repeat protein [Syntrophales bacterium]|nr:tetratricopeptide repeat protein [Syntrophales bacterium]